MKLPHVLGLLAALTLVGTTGLAAHLNEAREHRAIGAHDAPVVAGTTAAPIGAPPVVTQAKPGSPTSSKTKRTAARTAPVVGQRRGTKSSSRPHATPKARAASAVDPAWARRTASTAGIPLPALTAYARASVLAPRGCRIGWTTLAGVGWVESQHGTIGNRRLHADGRSSSRILGPALTGAGALAAIPATRVSAQWHGDRTWDHAVGPMQFIPSTWRTWQTDGDGNGVADPNDLDDASLAAARYLCQSGDLMAGDNWSQAMLSYNFSSDYVLNVYTAADAYADRTS